MGEPVPDYQTPKPSPETRWNPVALVAVAVCTIIAAILLLGLAVFMLLGMYFDGSR